MSVDLALRKSHLRIPDVADVSSVLTRGSNISMSMTMASQLTAVMLDPSGVIAESGAVTDGQIVKWGGLEFAVVGSKHHAPNRVRVTTITAHSKGIVALRKRKGDRKWSGMSPTAVVRAECAAVGLAVVAQDTGPRKSISRLGKAKDRPATDSWKMFQDLAAESGFIVCEVAGTVYFAAPSWLVKRDAWTIRAEAAYMAAYPDMTRMSVWDESPGTGMLTIFGNQPAEILLPCTPVVMVDVPKPHQGRYLVESCEIDLSRAEVVPVQLTTPVDPEKQDVS